jgi:hypothetical protein
MAQATQIVSADLLPVNDYPPPPSIEQELAKALEDNPQYAKGSAVMRQGSDGHCRTGTARSSAAVTIIEPSSATERYPARLSQAACPRAHSTPALYAHLLRGPISMRCTRSPSTGNTWPSRASAGEERKCGRVRS